jgi:hypothetical protein
LLVLSCGPATALAAEPPPHISVRLAYDHGAGIEGCPDERGVRYELMAAFGYDPTEPPLIADFTAPPLLRIVVSRQGTQLRAVASEVQASGHVVWGGDYQDHAECRDLVRNIALVIRVGIGVDAARPAPPAPAPAPALPPVIADSAPPEPRPAAGTKIRVGLGSDLAFGIAPAAAVGFSLQVGLRWPRASLSLEGRADLPAASEALGIRTSMVSGTLLPCLHFWTYGAACGVLTVGSRRSALLDDARLSEHTSSAYLGVGARGAVEVPFAGRWLLRFSGEAVVAALPTIVRVGSGKAERWRSAPVAGGPGIGLLMNFDGP